MLEFLLSSFNRIIAGVVQWLSDALINSINCDMDMVIQIFPAMEYMLDIIRGIAIGIILLMFTWQVIGLFFPKFDMAKVWGGVNPVESIARFFVSMFLVVYSEAICNIGLNIGNKMYESIGQIKIEGENFMGNLSQIESLGDWMGEAASLVAMETSGVMLVISIIFYLFFAINFFRLTIEIVQRYIFVGILVYTAPLPLCTYVSYATEPIMAKWVRMFAGQLLLLSMNLWSVNVLVSALKANVPEDAVLIYMFSIIAFLKLAQQFDSVMQRLGVPVATTGSGMTAEILSAAAVAGKAFSKISKFNAAGGTGASGTTPLGASATGADTYKPSNSNYIAGASINGGSSTQNSTLHSAAYNMANAVAQKATNSVNTTISNAGQSATMAGKTMAVAKHAGISAAEIATRGSVVRAGVDMAKGTVDGIKAANTPMPTFNESLPVFSAPTPDGIVDGRIETQNMYGPTQTDPRTQDVIGNSLPAEQKVIDNLSAMPELAAMGIDNFEISQFSYNETDGYD